MLGTVAEGLWVMAQLRVVHHSGGKSISWLCPSKSSTCSREKEVIETTVHNKGVVLFLRRTICLQLPRYLFQACGMPFVKGHLLSSFFSTCDQEWDAPCPSMQTIQSPVSSHISPSASSDGCLIWGLTSPFAVGFISCLPHILLCSQAAEEMVCLMARHPQPTLMVSTKKIWAKARSDLVNQARCGNYAHLHKCH